MSSGEHKVDRVDALFAEAAAMYKAELRKCSAEESSAAASGARRYTSRAKAVVMQAVKVSGGASLVSDGCDYDESNIRLQLKHPDRTPSLETCCGCDPEGIELVIDFLHAVADEKRRLRRVG